MRSRYYNTDFRMLRNPTQRLARTKGMLYLRPQRGVNVNLMDIGSGIGLSGSGTVYLSACRPEH